MPLDETINILVNKAFTDDWFTKTDGFTLQEDQLAELLKTATTNQLFSFNGELYEQTNGVAMGSPPGPYARWLDTPSVHEVCRRYHDQNA